ncbi:MAG: putative alpha/beta hydrolase [Nevskia sp.]|nr:putative alpha/beta hydrolase [Nevskia sp.]
MSTSAASYRSVTIQAAGAALAGRFYRATAAASSEPILLCSATGVTQGFYTAFAEWLAAKGYSVLTFDYRGIGESLSERHVKFSAARKQDWGQLDMPAALDCLLAETGASHAHLIGHSAGGQLFGLMPNHAKIRSVLAVASSTGYVGGLRAPTRWAARALLSLFIPISCAVLGYAPSKIIGWGEDLPRGVALQWSRWCLRPGYVENDFGAAIKTHYYREVAAPIVAIHAADDPIATSANVADLLRLFPRATKRSQQIEPAEFGLQSIGHIDIFRRRCAAAWPKLLPAGFGIPYPRT